MAKTLSVRVTLEPGELCARFEVDELTESPIEGGGVEESGRTIATGAVMVKPESSIVQSIEYAGAPGPVVSAVRAALAVLSVPEDDDIVTLAVEAVADALAVL